MSDHVILVAFQVSGQDSMQAAQQYLFDHVLPDVRNHDHLECWWVAMDERWDGSDCESAMFVPTFDPVESERLLRMQLRCTQLAQGFVGVWGHGRGVLRLTAGDPDMHEDLITLLQEQYGDDEEADLA